MSHKAGASRTARERLRETVEYVRMSRAHRSIVRSLTPASSGGPVRRVIILPADVRDPAGSRGDEAMLTAVVGRVLDTFPDAQIDVATLPGAEIEVAGARIVPIWSAPWRLPRVWGLVQDYDALVVIGADVLDGYYSSVTSMRLWILADLMARTRGHDRATVVGFSFNETPTWPVIGVLRRRVGDHLAINVRDPRSFQRFTKSTGRTAALVADSAFMLKEDDIDRLSVSAWISNSRTEGRTVCGLNIHPMLSPDRDPEMLERLTQAVAHAARTSIDDTGCAWVLIPHDFREVHGDVDLLTRLAEAIDRPGAVHLVEDELSASQIKALAARVDAVVTGRMHLAIAALGSGTPAAGITYQGKFDGLMVDHFGLPSDLLLTAEEATDPDAMDRLVTFLVSNRAELGAAVQARLDEILRLSGANLAGLVSTDVSSGGRGA